MTVVLSKPVLIVVDVQNDFVHPAGMVGRAGRDMTPLLQAVEAINHLVDRARAASVPVVYVRVTHSPIVDNPAYRARYEARGMSVEDLLCADGSWGAELYEGLRPPAESEIVVTKHAYDGFAVEALRAYLSVLGVDTAIVVGVVTELCVMGTVAGAFENGFHVVVAREGAGSADPAAAEAAYNLIARFYGTVASVEEVAAAFEETAGRVERRLAAG
jgi:ureidoacrylate peracid hydrolase